MPPEADPSSAPLRDQLAASEANLRESQELFAKSFHSSPALMTIAALPSGEFIEVNEAFLRAIDRTRAHVIGHTTLDLNLWCDLAQREAFIQQISAHVSVRDFEAEFNAGTGERRCYLLNADRIELKGRPCILTVAVDITERRRRVRVEEALAIAERRYRNLFANAAEGLYLSSVEGHFIEVNPALARMFGYASPAACVADVQRIDEQLYVDPRRRAAFFELLQSGDVVTDFESEIRRTDGSTFWVSESVQVVRDDAGNIDHFEGVAVDVTARREAARALLDAREAAETANRAKSQFLASMSHELRTPLNGILGFTQILRRDSKLAPEHQHGVDVIHASAEHLLGLINDVLDLSKVEAGRLELHRASLDLPTLLAGVAELLGPRAREKGLAFAATIPPDLPTRVVTDAARLRQVLLNLVANALKFTRDGSITLAAARPPGTEAPPDHAVVRFSVRDTGCGIATKDLVHLFEPFKQIGEAHRHAEGTGLGLAISHRLVSALGGTLSVASTLGAGSHFWFDLVLPLANETTTPFAPSSPIIGYEGPVRHVLVVDDHAANAEVLLGLLQPLGFEVATAESGEAALAQTAVQWPDLILMDLRMPGMGGLAAIKALRAQPAGASLGIIAVSASVFDFDRTEALAHGCDEFLPKPVRAEALLNAVGNVLDLTWRQSHGGSNGGGTSVPFGEVTTPPPLAEVVALHELALTGDVVALRERAQALLNHSPAQAEFASTVLELTRSFKLKALRKLLQRWLT